MMFPIVYFFQIAQQPQVNLEVNANDLLWFLLTGLVAIVGFFIMRSIKQQDRNYEKLEVKVDNLDHRMDKLEQGQVKIMTRLEID